MSGTADEVVNACGVCGPLPTEVCNADTTALVSSGQMLNLPFTRTAPSSVGRLQLRKTMMSVTSPTSTPKSSDPLQVVPSVAVASIVIVYSSPSVGGSPNTSIDAVAPGALVSMVPDISSIFPPVICHCTSLISTPSPSSSWRESEPVDSSCDPSEQLATARPRERTRSNG